MSTTPTQRSARVEIAFGVMLVFGGFAAAVFAVLGMGDVRASGVAIPGVLLLVHGHIRSTRAIRALPGAGRNRVGALPILHAGLSGLYLGAVVATLTQWTSWVPLALSDNERLAALAALVGGTALVTLVGATLVWTRARQLQPGTPGRGRLFFRGAMSWVFVPLSLAPLGLLAFGAYEAARSGFAFTHSIEEAWLSLSPSLQMALLIVGIPTAVLMLIDLGLMIGAWFLLPRRVRVVFWALADLALLAGFALVTWTLPIEPATTELADLREPMIRLGVTALFATRVLLRFMPLIMGGLGRFSFHTFVAARHLRSKKSGFLAAIGGLSILAVSMSTCMLTTVLSVMGGFRDDLKQKILGNHAHVVVDRADDIGTSDEFEGWSAVLEATRRAEGVVAATPYVEGEVMVTSASNRSTALLRGIDVDTIGSVTDLEANLTNGRLEYLRHPELLLNLPPEERRSILPMRMFEDDDDDDLPPAHDQIEDMDRDSLLREVERAIGDVDGVALEDLDSPPVVPLGGFEPGSPRAPPASDAFPDTPEDSDADVLPGIIVGKELARTLRLFVGDEIDVVSPLGELGPAGPMPKARRYRVAGVFYSGMYEYDMKLVYVLLDSAQRFLNAGDAISGIEVKVDDVERAPLIAGAVREAIARDDLRVQDWQELNKNLFGALALEKLAMFVVLGFAVLIAGFCVFGTLTLMVQEKGREVGILKAMGTTARAVVGVFMFEGFLIGIFGAISGLGLGYLVVFILEKFGIRLNPEVYYIDRLPVHIDPMEFAIVGVSAVLVCLVATIFPALLASRMRPIEALRHF